MKKILITGLIVLLAACATPGNEITFEFTGLEPLTQGHYEGWAIIGEEKISTGKFNIGDKLSFSVADISAASKIVVTIEPDGDTDEIPSGVVVLAGDLVENNAALSFPVDLSQVSGKYILATPTNGDETIETSGIWFLQLPPPPSAGLVLPELPSGWIYEGWAVNQETPLTSGKFASPDGIDNFDGYSGSEPGPPFPGEDYLVNAPEGVTFPLDLADGNSLAVISVEPDLDGVDPTGDAPFSIKPLVVEIPAGAADHVTYDLGQNLGSIPTGTAVLS